jgi:hypothetical protein
MKTVINADIFIVPNGFNDGYVQVWGINDEYENLACHSVDRIFPISLPLPLLIDKEEGSVFEFKYTGYDNVERTFILTCNQSAHQYSKFGNFEQVLEDIVLNALRRYRRKIS